MSKLLGGKLTMQPLVQSGKPGPSPYGTRSYVCRRCGVEFQHYKGIRYFGNGVGLCPEHNTKEKRDDQG